MLSLLRIIFAPVIVLWELIVVRNVKFLIRCFKQHIILQFIVLGLNIFFSFSLGVIITMHLFPDGQIFVPLIGGIIGYSVMSMLYKMPIVCYFVSAVYSALFGIGVAYAGLNICAKYDWCHIDIESPKGYLIIGILFCLAFWVNIHTIIKFKKAEENNIPFNEIEDYLYDEKEGQKKAEREYKKEMKAIQKYEKKWQKKASRYNK